MSPRKAQRTAVPSNRVRIVGIRTLGQFRLSIDGRSVQFQRRAQRRVIELLKALIALGRPAVGTTRLMDALWNESEGDRASRCLATTVYRLRELLRAKDAILYADGQLALNPRYCWVDVWALERQLITVESTGRSSSEDINILSQRYRDITQLYRGDFLDAERSYPWAEPMRDKLRARYLNALRAWGQRLRQHDRHEEAAAVYCKGLEINPVAEDCYCQLMRCLAMLGRRAEVALIYRQCCAVLEDEFGLSPAPETRALYLSLCGREVSDSTPFTATIKNGRIVSSFIGIPQSVQLLRRPNR